MHKIRRGVLWGIALLMLLGVFCTKYTQEVLAVELAQPVIRIADYRRCPRIVITKVKGATGYRIYRKAAGDAKWTKLVTTRNTSYVDAKWQSANATMVRYTVKAYYKDADGHVTWSKAASVRKWTAPDRRPFYGVWIAASKDLDAIGDMKAKLLEQGFPARVVYAPEWPNLTDEPYYCLTAGICSTRTEAEELLAKVQQEGWQDAYIKGTGTRENKICLYTCYSNSALEVTEDQVLIRDVQVSDKAGEEEETMTLIVDRETLFAENPDGNYFDNVLDGDTPLTWMQHNYEEPDDQYLQALVGVFEVEVTGNHIDRFIDCYWWD